MQLLQERKAVDYRAEVNGGTAFIVDEGQATEVSKLGQHLSSHHPDIIAESSGYHILTPETSNVRYQFVHLLEIVQ